ncbi:serine protease easter-like [Cylas formicarius]|nr:serine protease easter-like [Cylas formicarius]
MQYSVEFTEYIHPICLPLQSDLKRLYEPGQQFFVSGWGKISSRKLGGSMTLQIAGIFLWNQTKCHEIIPKYSGKFLESQLCANGENQDACKGDSGGPMFAITTDSALELKYFQIGIVSFAPSLSCGTADLPSIYTRVDSFLKWILEIVSSN